MRAFILALAVSTLLLAPESKAQHLPAYGVDDSVSIRWSAGWFPGKILAVDGDRYRVRYDGYGESWDEWVTAERLRPATTGEFELESAATLSPPPVPTPSAEPPSAEPPTGVHGTWRYQSWISTPPGQPRGEILNSDVTYWLTIRPSGTWSLTNTTRWSPNSPDHIAGGRYTLAGGQLVLRQSGTPARTYGRYTVEQDDADQMTLRETSTGDVIVLRRGRS
jgi:hypothetical protein